MRYLFIACCLTLCLAVISPAQSPSTNPDPWTVSLCPVRLLQGAADFNGAFYYIAKTNKDGVVTDVKESNTTILSKFVDTREFIPCIKNWRLSPSAEHVITFGVGTIFFDRKPNYISIASKTQKLKIIVPDEIFEWSSTKNRKN